MGYQSHLSLFFVIMLGENDALLKWPFKHKVSMILVGKCERCIIPLGGIIMLFKWPRY